MVSPRVSDKRHGKRMANAWQNHGKRHDKRMTNAMANPWQTHGKTMANAMANAWQTHRKTMTNMIFVHQAKSKHTNPSNRTQELTIT